MFAMSKILYVLSTRWGAFRPPVRAVKPHLLSQGYIIFPDYCNIYLNDDAKASKNEILLRTFCPLPAIDVLDIFDKNHGFAIGKNRKII
ncbi:MAG TPA: hypothetical protein DCM27_00035 [Rhodospirillaceae bacterium]|nr:hypothetical protein [Rhodospirillaceae bacterium]